MLRNRFVRLSAVLVALALLLPAVATHVLAKDSKGALKAEIQIVNEVVLSGTHLKAGDYSIVADENKAKFTHNGKTVAEASITWQDNKVKSQSTALVLEGENVKEIRFGGNNKVALVQ